jgi:hypothetical protein
MTHIYIPTQSADDWRQFLADPEKQWRKGYSARELAECWQSAPGFPESFQALLSGAEDPVLRKIDLLFAIPEHKVDLPGGGRASQNDLFVLGKASDGELVSIMVEGKVGEPFGETLETWLVNASPGKRARLKFLCETLGLSQEPPGHIRYQLFHRTVSAILEARRFNARYAMMIVHSFSPEKAWFPDYAAFLELFGVSAGPGQLLELPGVPTLRLFAGWVTEESLE